MYFYKTPTVKQGPLSPDRLGMRYTLDYGVTVFKAAGVWHQAQYVSQLDLIAADIVFMGGHEYLIDDETASELLAAGFGAGLTLDDLSGDGGGFGVGWGTSGWGSDGWGF